MRIENREENEDNLLELKDVEYCYEDGFTALKGVNVTFRKGRITAVIGANGAGKSTLLLTLNGINRPTGGEVLYRGRRMDYSKKSLKELRKNVGIVFQNPDIQLFSSSVSEDISFGPMNLDLPQEEVKKRVDTAMDSLRITHLKDRSVHSLSYGQKKKVSIAGIVAMEPEVIIMDEPTAGLDPSGVSDMRELIDDLKKRYGITLIVSTHDMDLIPLISDDVVILSEGRVLYSGPTEGVFQDPELIRGAGLRLPRITHLFEILGSRGIYEGRLPESIEEAVAVLSETDS